MRLFWTDTSGSLQEIEFDASLKELHNTSAEITSHPIEAAPGSTSVVTDGMQKNPDRITLEAHVSDDPVYLPRTQNRGVTGSVTSLALGALPTKDFSKGQTQGQGAQYTAGSRQGSATTFQMVGTLERTRDVWQALRNLVGVQTVSLSTSLADYDNLAVVDVGAPRSAEEGRAVTFSIELEAITVVSSQTVATPAPSQPRGRAGANRGNQPANAAGTGNPPSGGSASIARQLTRRLGLQP